MTWNIERDLTVKNCILGWFFTSLVFVMNAHHDFTALDWNYVSVQDTAGHSELKLIDDDFPTFEIDQNESIDVGPSASKALTLQEPVIYFNQSAEDLAKYSKIVKFFSPMQIHTVSAWKRVKFDAKMTNQPKIQFMALKSLSIFHVTYVYHHNKSQMIPTRLFWNCRRLQEQQQLAKHEPSVFQS